MAKTARIMSILALVSISFPCFAADGPNVLLIVADDHSPYVCGAYGNEKVETPNLDRLAAEGMRFDRAYCNSPMCTASRQSFLTGRYPRTIGVTQLRTPLPEEEVTLAEMLLAEGYSTAAIGKMHFNSNLKHGFEHRLDRGDHRRFLQEHGKTPVGDIETLPPWRPFRDPARIWLNADILPYGAVEADMDSTYFAQEAVDYLESKKDERFFLTVSFYQPHSPFHFPVEYAGRHTPDEFDAPDVAPQDHWQVPEIFEELTEEDKRGIRAAYYTSVEFMDKNVGTVLDAVDRLGLKEDTLVVYIGDHGYMLGQHGRIEKHCSYEPAVRSPLIIRYPGLVEEGSSTDALVEFVDIAPTALDYCGMEIPKRVQGKSLRPVLSGRASEHRDHVVVEYSENEEAMIRTDRWKLVYITGNRVREDGYKTREPIPKDIVLLFDTKNDPRELHNLADEPEHQKLVSELMNQLAAHMVRTSRLPELIPDTEDPRAILTHCLQPRDVPTG